MLIELIVATLIASMIGALLLTALSQGTRFQRSVDMLVDMSLRVGIATNQLEKDFMGAFIPMQARLKEEKDEDADESADNKKEDQGAQKKSAEPKKETPKTENKQDKINKPAEKPLEKIFYATTKSGNLDTLTFITNNPLTVFVGKDVGIVKPKIVRAQYTLKPENENDKKSDTFVLMRQESNELDLSKYTNVRAYELIGGIKDFSITYTARIKKENEKTKKDSVQADTHKEAVKTNPEEKPKIEYEYKVLKEWVSEPKEPLANDNKQEENFPRIPFMMEIKMTLWNMQHTKTEDFVLVFELPFDI
jgi:hypothetical protein